MERQTNEREKFLFVPVRLDNAKLRPFAANRIFLDFSSYPDGPNGGELLSLLHAIVGVQLRPEAVHFATEQVAAKQAADDIEAAIFNNDPERLVELFATSGLAWETASALGCKRAEGLIKLKRNDDAIGMLNQIEQRFPRAIRPRQLRALALARRGQPGDLRLAQQLLGALYKAGEKDPRHLASTGEPGWTAMKSQGICPTSTSPAICTQKL